MNSSKSSKYLSTGIVIAGSNDRMTDRNQFYIFTNVESLSDTLFCHPVIWRKKFSISTPLICHPVIVLAPRTNPTFFCQPLQERIHPPK
jgi:hypothetical protein